MKNIREKSASVNSSSSSSSIPVLNAITTEEAEGEGERKKYHNYHRTKATATAEDIIPTTASADVKAPDSFIPVEATEKNSKVYFNFINSIQSPASRRTYEFIINKYMQYYDVQAVDDLLLLALGIIEDQIIRWLVSLRDKVSFVTRRRYMAAILMFYEINDITLRKKKIAKYLG